ncbi:swr complex subunit, partial [Thoreauomyces humboldtii]
MDLQGSTSGEPPPQLPVARKLPKPDKPKEKKGDSLSRELLQLTGGAPPLVLAKRKYKARPNFSKQGKVASWLWRDFLNPARADSLKLQHWVKATDEEEYYFAKFNKSLEMVEYSDEEYDTVIKNLKHAGTPSWTKAETDYLYDLIRRFDLRWLVIHDRYEWANLTRRIDDLKERYYAISHALLTARGSTGPELAGYSFSKPHELERKKNLETLYGRTPEQTKEEEYLFFELRRREQKEERMAKEREAVWLLLRDNEHRGAAAREFLSGTPGSTTGTPVANQAVEKLKKKKLVSTKRSISQEGASSSSHPETPTSASGPPRKKSRIEAPLRATPDVEEVSQIVKRLGHGAFARSHKIPPMKPTYLPRIHEIMHELGVRHTARPWMPTAAVCDAFTELQTTCQTLLETKKVHDRVLLDLHKLRKRAKATFPLSELPPATVQSFENPEPS